MKFKKHLSCSALCKFVSTNLLTWKDPRRKKSTEYSVHDAVLSGFACMYYQEPSLLEFQQHLENQLHQNNLRTLFGVKNIPKTNTLKEIIDTQDSRNFNSLFKGIAPGLICPNA